MNDQDKLAKIQNFESLISGKNRKLDETDLELEQLKKRRKEEEADRDATVNHMLAFIRGEDAGLFDNPSGSASTQSDTTAVKIDYRTVTLKELGLAGGKMGKSLVAAGLTTLAAIGEYTAKGKRLTDLESIGQGKADLIIQACDKWWSEHPPETDEESENAAAFKMKDAPVETATETAADPNATVPEAGATEASEPKPVVAIEKPMINLTEYDDPQAALAHVESAFNECRSVLVQAIGGNQPKVKAVEMQDVKNRFNRGFYICVDYADNAYTMQRVYEKRDWIQRLGEYAKAEGGDGNPPGMYSQCVVVNIDNNVEMYISGEDEQFKMVNDIPAAVPAES